MSTENFVLCDNVLFDSCAGLVLSHCTDTCTFRCTNEYFSCMPLFFYFTKFQREIMNHMLCFIYISKVTVNFKYMIFKK